MKKTYFSILLATALCAMGSANAYSRTSADDVVVTVGGPNAVKQKAGAKFTSQTLRIDGTGQSETFTVVATDLTQDISVTATHGFSVTPATIKAGTAETQVTVTHLTTLSHCEGKVILRSGDVRSYVPLVATGTPLEPKDISANAAYAGGKDEKFTAAGFQPGKNGYTIEVRAKVDDASKNLRPYAVTSDGFGIMNSISSTGINTQNSENGYTSKGLSNPSNGGTFYNTDGLYHTYRYAVTPDHRAFVYRDGIAIDTLRLADYGLQPDWAVENGDMKENLIKNGDFEGEHDFSSSRNITYRIEGWDVYPYDQYNSTQSIKSEERSNEVDQNNHVMALSRYMWNDGWSAGEISQIVDVAPGETYSFSCLAKGGQYNGSPLGQIRIQDMQNSDNSAKINVTSDSYQTYAHDFETKANTRQLKVMFYLERAKWGASVSAFTVDDVKLTGVSRVMATEAGFLNDGADVEYFAIDNTGAYAPLMAELTASADKLTIEGTGSSRTFTINAANLTGDISVTATHGFSVSPATIKAGIETAEITVTNDTWLATSTGRVVLRSGDKRCVVELEGHGSGLQNKDIAANPVYAGGTDEKFTAADFKPGQNGYTIEFSAKVDDASKVLHPYMVTADGYGIMNSISSEAINTQNSENGYTSKGLSNPSNGGTFYNTDGLYHTYRYAVTPDRRAFVYRDGIAIDTLRLADYGLQPDWTVENGDMKENLIKNGDFEGEHNFSSSRNITYRIEGWDVYPYDQYNSYQDVEREERSNEVDQYNHVLSIHRYMWNDGWSDGEISQIVDVAPGETYSFSCLAKGGQYNGSALGQIRIQDMQNSDNSAKINVTSDSYQTYAHDFETKANTKQVKIMFALGRAKWGASVSAFKVDDVKLTGVSRVTLDKAGFLNDGADVKYFAIDNTGAYAPLMASLTASAKNITINGTDQSQTFSVNAANLTQDISVTATHGFSVTPATIKAGTAETQVTVTNTSYQGNNTGRVILRSGDKRCYVELTGHGSELPTKNLAGNAAYAGGKDETFTAEGFKPGENGYTIEVRARVDEASKNLRPYAVTSDGYGIMNSISSTGINTQNSNNGYTSKGLSNPSNGGTFYNTDGQYHTYRYAVTPDHRAFVYRDGIAIDTLRLADYGLQPDWTVENGDMKENLIKNGDFEGEHEYSSSRGITYRIEGWDVYPYDQWNTTQEVKREERSNEVDQNNHVMAVDRYMWDDGWCAGEISQIVDVAPGETYSFSCLAKGGQYNGSPLGQIRIQDMQNSDNLTKINVTSDSYQTYAHDFATKANTKQIKVMFYIEKAKWGASVSPLTVDNVKLTGVSRVAATRAGFLNEGSDIEYFAFDNTGAYAPLMAELNVSADKLVIEGTGSSRTFTIDAANLTGDISLTATHGFSVSPATIKAGTAKVTVRVTNDTWLANSTGRVVLRSGDKRCVVELEGHGSDLETKDIAANPAYTGGTDETFVAADFNPGENGYTIEFSAKVDDASKTLRPYAVTSDGYGIMNSIGSTGINTQNSENGYTSKGLSNPSNGGTFYNTDGLYHTYRYAVTPDHRAFVYRDGIAIDTLRLADYGLQPDWAVETGKPVRNLLRNGDFEGEHDFSSSRNITYRIEGWDVYPYDQYNSYQDIKSEERSNEVDQYNHVLSMHRYMWNDGWAAGEISQIVDVAPGEVYSFSCLAKGGQYKDSPLGQIRIQDMQNSDNSVKINVTSDSYKTYACDFDTKANTRQIKVMFALERAKWGASVSAFNIDNVKLTGYSRVIDTRAGFLNDGSDVQYFAIDNTGAYAPSFPSLTANDIVDAVDAAQASVEGLRVSTSGNAVAVYGAGEGCTLAIYTFDGKAVAMKPRYTDGTLVALPGRGTYLVLAIDGDKRRTVKIDIR